MDFFQNNFDIFKSTQPKKGIIPQHAGKISPILDVLDAANSERDLDLPGFKLPPFLVKNASSGGFIIQNYALLGF